MHNTRGQTSQRSHLVRFGQLALRQFEFIPKFVSRFVRAHVDGSGIAHKYVLEPPLSS